MQSFMIQLNDARKPDILESFTFTAKCNIRVIFRCKLVHFHTGLLQPSHFLLRFTVGVVLQESVVNRGNLIGTSLRESFSSSVVLLFFS